MIILRTCGRCVIVVFLKPYATEKILTDKITRLGSRNSIRRNPVKIVVSDKPYPQSVTNATTVAGKNLLL